MKILRIQLYPNRIAGDLAPYMTYAYPYFKKHGVELHFDISPVSVSGYSSVQQDLAGGGTGYVLQGAESLVATTSDHDAHIFLFDLNEWKAPWYSLYPLRADAPRSSCIPYKGKPFISFGYYPKDLQNNLVTFIHETMHALRMIAGVSDVMDSYRENNFPDSPTGNFAEQWKLLEPWLNPVIGIRQTTVDLIAGFEGFSDKPYRDVAGNWTIGYGFTTLDGVPVTSKTPAISLKDAKVQLVKKIGIYADAVKQVTLGLLNQNQFDACVSLCYNIGVSAFKSSTVVRDINMKNYQYAADAFLLWNRSGGRIVPGLVARRKKESTLFLS